MKKEGVVFDIDEQLYLQHFMNAKVAVTFRKFHKDVDRLHFHREYPILRYLILYFLVDIRIFLY